MRSTGTTAVVRKAMRQHGVISRADIRGLGTSDERRRTLVRSGTLHEMAPGIYLLAGTPLDWSTKLRVAVRQAEPSGAAAFGSAAVIWALPGFAEGPVEVVIVRGAARPARPIGRIHRVTRWVPGDIVEHDGLRVTSPLRTISDLASRLDAGHLDHCIQDLARRGLITLDRLARRLGTWRASGCRGVKALEQAIERNASAPRSESFLETAFFALLRDHGLPLPEFQVEVLAGSQRYRVDCLYRRHDLVVELKGHGTHSTRAALNADSAREAALLSVGLRVLSFTYDQVMTQPGVVARRLASVLEAAWPDKG